jgi:hypothetical protein
MKRYSELCQRTALGPSDFVRDNQHKTELPSRTFKPPTHLSREKVVGGVAVDAIMNDRTSWTSTTPQLFINQQCLLLTALTASVQADWEKLWMAGLLTYYMLVSIFDEPADGEPDEVDNFFLIFDASPYLLQAWALFRDSSDGLLHFQFEVEHIVSLTVPSLTHFRCHDYQLVSLPGTAEFCLRVTNGTSLQDYIVENRLSRMTGPLLERLCRDI